jgi:hypothetical protein
MGALDRLVKAELVAPERFVAERVEAERVASFLQGGAHDLFATQSLGVGFGSRRSGIERPILSARVNGRDSEQRSSDEPVIPAQELLLGSDRRMGPVDFSCWARVIPEERRDHR